MKESQQSNLPMKIFIALLLLVVFQSCNGQKSQKDRTAIVYDGYTLIAVPDFDRDIGFDSIQLLIRNGKIIPNFCYPNGLRFKKDTVYTEDSIYKKWFNVFQLAPNVILSTNDGFATFFSNGYIDMRKGYFDSLTVDSFKIKITKVPQ